ncbi:Rha family transcriptional regulator [Gracilibacillus sp. D59]|uniref:Rha family transcriptional regulator n=1 Tax=Gracilibacillus sp. D59 TaxID=3457434 RepID=UPI003FCE4B1C
MNQLKVSSINGKLVAQSREVAEWIDKSHKELMRSIRQYVDILTSAELRSLDFFIPHYYRDAKGEQRPCFLLTRKGCDMVANKMTGQKGVLFTAEYVTRFEQMEKQFEQNEPKNELEILQRTVNSLVTVENRVTYLEDHMRVDGVQERKLQNKGKSIVIESLGGLKSNAYQQISKKVFAAIWRDFKNHFEIPRYNELPKKQFEDGMKFLGMWQPSTSLRIEIEELNQQQSIQGVI